MIAGAIAFFVYALSVSYVMMRFPTRALFATAALLPLWFAVAFGLRIIGL
jgi:hypothetical protein